MKKFKNRLALVVAEFELKEKLTFKPTLAFFEHLEIGRKRFHQLMRNDRDITFQEMQRLAQYFKVNVLELHERTLPLLEMTVEKALSYR